METAEAAASSTMTVRYPPRIRVPMVVRFLIPLPRFATGFGNRPRARPGPAGTPAALPSTDRPAVPPAGTAPPAAAAAAPAPPAPRWPLLISSAALAACWVSSLTFSIALATCLALVVCSSVAALMLWLISAMLSVALPISSIVLDLLAACPPPAPATIWLVFCAPADDRLHARSRAACAIVHPGGHAPAALLDQLLDLLGRGGAALGQLSHLIGHHREPPPVLAGPRRFNRGIQGQQVGLVGDLADHPHDASDPLTAGGDGLDRLHRLAHRLRAPPRLVHRVLRGEGNLPERPGNLLDGGCIRDMPVVDASTLAAWLRAWPFTCSTLAVSFSTPAAVSCRVEAWLCAVRASSVAVPVSSAPEAATCPVDSRITRTSPCNRSTISRRARRMPLSLPRRLRRGRR